MADSQEAPNIENTMENGAEKQQEKENASDLENSMENGADKEGTFEGEQEKDGREGDREKKPFKFGIRSAPDAANFFCQLLADSPLLTLGNIEPLCQRLAMPIRFARDLHNVRKEYKKEQREAAHERKMDAANKLKTNDPSENQVIMNSKGVKVIEIGNTASMKFGKDGRGKINTVEKMYAVERQQNDGSKTTEFLTKNELKKAVKGIKIPQPRLTDAEKGDLKARYNLTEYYGKKLDKKYKSPDTLRPQQPEKDKSKDSGVRPQQAETDKKKDDKTKGEKAKGAASKGEKKKTPRKRASKEQNPELKKLKRQQKRLEKQITEAEKQNPNFDKTPEGKKMYDKLILNDVKQQQVALEDKITKAEKQNPNYDKTKEGKADYKKLIDLDKQASALKQPKKDNKSKGLTLASAPQQIGKKKTTSKAATAKARNIKAKEDTNNRSAQSLQKQTNRLKNAATRTNRTSSKGRTSTRTSSRTPYTAPRSGKDSR